MVRKFAIVRMTAYFTMMFFCFSAQIQAAVLSVYTGSKQTSVVETAAIDVLGSTAGAVRITAKGANNAGAPGQPDIPWQVITVLLPPNAELQSVTAELDQPQYTDIAGVWTLKPVPPMSTWDKDGNPLVVWPSGVNIDTNGQDTAIYSSNAFWPAEPSVVGTGRMHQWQLAEVAVPLVSWNPQTGRLQELVSSDVRINFSRKNRGRAAQQRPVMKHRGRAEKLAVNFSAAAGDYDDSASSADSSVPVKQMASADSDYAAAGASSKGYVIITTSAIADGSSQLNNFVTHKQSKGWEVHVKTQADWGGGTGGTGAANIRNWLKNNYSSLDILYVLLIGNPHPDTGDVPMQWYDDGQGAAPTDVWYGDLDDDTYDRYWEVVVGRIPYYGTLSYTDGILQKTMNYENSTSTLWRRNVMLSMVPLDESTPVYQCGEQIKYNLLEPRGIASTRIYDDTYGLVPPPEYKRNYDYHMKDIWKNGDYGIVVWQTHGSQTHAGQIIGNWHAWELDNAHPSAVYEGSCQNAWPENSENLAYTLLKNGAITTVAATRNSYYTPSQTDFTSGGSIGSLGYRYAKYLAAGQSCGLALANSKQDSWLYWANMNRMLIYGDPSVVVVTGDDFKGHWKLDEITGTQAADSGAAGKHGTLHGTTFDAGSIAGIDGQALNLDGTDDHIVLSDLGLYSNKVTLTCWIKCAAAPVPWSGIIFNRMINANGLNFGNNAELRYHWNNSNWAWNSGLTVPANVWTFVALVIQPDKGTIYMDSGSGLQSAINSATHNSEPWDGNSYIGRDPAESNRHFKGAMDDVRIFSKALTVPELEAIRSSGDYSSPVPNPMTWATLPYESGAGAVTMTATEASDPSGVQYYFDCVSGGGHDSGWQNEPTYTDTKVTSVTAEYRVKARDRSPHFNETQLSEPAVAIIAPYPYGGANRVIPGRIEAEEFDVAGEGLSYHDVTAGNSGNVFRTTEDVDIIQSANAYSVSDIADGEWLLYTVNTTDGITDVHARVASTVAGGQIKVLLDSQVLAVINVPNTGSDEKWDTVTVRNLEIGAGIDRELKLEFVNGGFGLDWIEFKTQIPYSGSPFTAESRVEFEDYDIGGQNIAYYDSTTGNSGRQYRTDDVDIYLDTASGQTGVLTNLGEWLEYSSALEPGRYTVLINYSSPYSSPQVTLADEQQTLAVINMTGTSGWYYWQDVSFADINVTGGEQVLRFTMTNSGAMLNYLRFMRQYNVADLNTDTRVNADDFAILAAQWLGAPATPSADIAPVGGDVMVDLSDLLIMAENWLVSE